MSQRNICLRANIEGVYDPYKGYTPLVRKAKITRRILVPIFTGSLPFLRGFAQAQVEQLAHCFVVGEGSPPLDDITRRDYRDPLQQHHRGPRMVAGQPSDLAVAVGLSPNVQRHAGADVA